MNYMAYILLFPLEFREKICYNSVRLIQEKKGILSKDKHEHG